MTRDEPAEQDGALRDERRRLRELRILVDLTANVIAQGHLSRQEALDLVAAARRRVLELFPDKEGTYELVLAPRFARLVAEYCPLAASMLPFSR